eukprot:1084309-Lingulodinium_polyedra.AAC.1
MGLHWRYDSRHATGFMTLFKWAQGPKGVHGGPINMIKGLCCCAYFQRYATSVGLSKSNPLRRSKLKPTPKCRLRQTCDGRPSPPQTSIRSIPLGTLMPTA